MLCCAALYGAASSGRSWRGTAEQILSWQHPDSETGDTRVDLAPVFDEINLRRARFLTRLASGRSVREVADEPSIAHETARSEVKRLKSLTGQESVGQLRAWWMLEVERVTNDIRADDAGVGTLAIAGGWTLAAGDNADRLTSISHDRGGTTLASVAYTLDDVGNRTQRIDQQGTHTYAYDDVYRLTSVTYPGPTTTGYAFDAFGNRTSMTTAAGTTGYAYDDADRLTAVTPPSPAPTVSYTWDDNGNLTNRGSDSFSWDYEDRMVSTTVGATTWNFAYRGDGLRDSRTTEA